MAPYARCAGSSIPTGGGRCSGKKPEPWLHSGQDRAAGGQDLEGGGAEGNEKVILLTHKPPHRRLARSPSP
jgi:hypothetical protein